MALWQLNTSIISLNSHATKLENPATSLPTSHANLERNKGEGAKPQTANLHPYIQLHTCVEYHAKALCSLVHCIQISLELNPHLFSFHTTKNPEATLPETHSNSTSKCTPKSCLNRQLWASNGKLIFNLFFILFVNQFFPSFTSISLLRRG